MFPCCTLHIKYFIEFIWSSNISLNLYGPCSALQETNIKIITMVISRRKAVVPLFLSFVAAVVVVPVVVTENISSLAEVIVPSMRAIRQTDLVAPKSTFATPHSYSPSSLRVDFSATPTQSVILSFASSPAPLRIGSGAAPAIPLFQSVSPVSALSLMRARILAFCKLERSDGSDPSSLLLDEQTRSFSNEPALKNSSANSRRACCCTQLPFSVKATCSSW